MYTPVPKSLKPKPKLTQTTIKIQDKSEPDSQLKPSKVKPAETYVINEQPRDIKTPKVQYVQKVNPVYSNLPPSRIQATPIVRDPPPAEKNPPPNLQRQQPSGVIVLKAEKKPEPKTPKVKKPTKRVPVYYSSDEEEEGTIKKIYSNDSRYRNYYCCNICKGRFANCCPFCSCFEWFYACPCWFYIILAALTIALFVTFWVLFALVLTGVNNPTTVTVTRIYNRTWGLYGSNCAVTPAAPATCTTYTTKLITEGYMASSTISFKSLNLKILMICFSFIMSLYIF